MKYLFAAPAAALLLCAGTLLVSCATPEQATEERTTPKPQQEPEPIEEARTPQQTNSSPQPPHSESKVGASHKPQRRVLPQAPAEPAAMRRLEQQLQEQQLQKVRSRDTLMSFVRVAGLHRAPIYQDYGRENYQKFADNGAQWATVNPVSTFSIDVDTASYANVRRLLNQGNLPNRDAVRTEELINYFNYNYPAADNEATPFGIYTEMGPSPWHTDRHLLHVGIKGWQPNDGGALPPANLVFLIDVSGSMQGPNKLDLLKRAMKMLVNQLRPQDQISIAVYAGAAGQALAPTPGDQKATINAAIDNLQAGGSTNGGQGIRLAYNLARQNLIRDGVNRVILATDGDFNVGTTDISDLEQMVEAQRKSGVALTVLGFGTGNYNDHLMQKIAQIGDGNAAYIDTINEARKVLVEEIGATLNIIAKDMKVQIEFNPEVVETYRLIGYETRHLNREDFNNDKVDAGEVGAGHTVTALYELTLKDGKGGVADPLRYGRRAPRSEPSSEAELAFLKLRYKPPGSDTSKLIERRLFLQDISDTLANTSESYRFSAAVAWFGQVLRNNGLVQNVDIQNIIALAQAAKGHDEFGYRSEFISLARTAKVLSVASVDNAKGVDHG